MLRFGEEGGLVFGSAVPVLPFQCGVSVRLFPGPHCSSAVFGFPFTPLHAPVCVAVSSTSLATTRQLVLKHGYWVAGGAPTSWLATLICCHRTIRMGGVSKWWADGLPLFLLAQLAVDTTLVSLVSCDGLPQLRSVREDEEGWTGLIQFGRVRLAALAGEVGF